MRTPCSGVLLVSPPDGEEKKEYLLEEIVQSLAAYAPHHMMQDTRPIGRVMCDPLAALGSLDL
jgi:hypothetical protein